MLCIQLRSRRAFCDPCDHWWSMFIQSTTTICACHLLEQPELHRSELVHLFLGNDFCLEYYIKKNTVFCCWIKMNKRLREAEIWAKPFNIVTNICYRQWRYALAHTKPRRHTTLYTNYGSSATLIVNRIASALYRWPFGYCHRSASPYSQYYLI